MGGQAIEDAVTNGVETDGAVSRTLGQAVNERLLGGGKEILAILVIGGSAILFGKLRCVELSWILAMHIASYPPSLA